MIRIKLLLTCAICIPLTLSGQDAKYILQQYFDTVSNGDVRNWEKIKSVYRESSSSYSQEAFEQKNPNFASNKATIQKMYRVWPDKSRVDLYEDSILVSSFYHVKKDHFFVMGNMLPMPMSSGPYEPYFEFEPIIIKHVLDKTKSIKLIGIRELDGLKCYVIRADTKDLIWHLYFNVTTFLLEYWNNSLDGDTSSLTKVFNYKKFDEYLIPTSEIKTRNGVAFFYSNVIDLKLNIEIDSQKFDYKKTEN